MTDQFEMFPDLRSIDESKGTRVCRLCKEEKSLESMRLSGRRMDGTPFYKNVCARCYTLHRTCVREFRKTHKKPDDYKCPICLEGDKEVKGRLNPESRHYNNTWVVDHDPQTMMFRGWLCDSCNKGLGIFRDNIHSLKRAINYLEEYKKSESC